MSHGNFQTMSPILPKEDSPMAKVEFTDPRVEVFITEKGLSKIKDVQENLMAKLPKEAKKTVLKGAYTGMLDKLRVPTPFEQQPTQYCRIAISTLSGKRGISSNLGSQDNGRVERRLPLSSQHCNVQYCNKICHSNAVY